MFTVLNNLRKREPLGRLKDFGIAEKIRHVDEQVIEERVEFAGFLLDQPQIFFEGVGLPHHHPAI